MAILRDSDAAAAGYGNLQNYLYQQRMERQRRQRDAMASRPMVLNDQDAARHGYANLETYRLACRLENERLKRGES